MKKLIAAAVAAAVIAPASVMAAGPTLYGKLHLGVESHDNNGSSADGTQYDEWSLNTRSSRIGVKGSEDLGNGMKVGYLIEWDVRMDGDGSDMGQRNRAVTLSGDWGTALAGRWDTPFKTVGRKIDMFGDQAGDLRNLNGDQDFRLDNVVAYVTPNMNGFSATIAYSFDAGTGCSDSTTACSGDNQDADAWSFNAIYNNGPLLVALGYTDADDAGQPSTTTTGGFALDSTTGLVTGAAPVTSANNTDNLSAWRLGGSYAFGDFKVAASYTDFDNVGFVDGADTDVWTLGASYKMGNNKIKFQYADRDETSSAADDGADMWALGIDHAMSKRTTVYAIYASTDNDDGSARTSWRGGNSSNSGVGTGGEKADTLAVGIIHKF